MRWLLLVLLASACAPAAPVPTAGAKVKIPRTVPTPLGDELVSEFDYRSYAVLSDQPALVGYVDFHRSSPTFSIGDYHHVRHHLRGIRLVDEAVGGCMGRTVAPDGKLCPSTVLPGIAVPRRDADTLVALFNAPRSGPPRVVMCGEPDFEHGLVFYDADNRPLGELTVSLTGCPGWQAWPGFDETFQSSEVRAELVALCRHLEWGRCDDDEVLPAAYEESDFFGLHGMKARRLRSTPPVTNASRRIDTLTPTEQRELCVWNAVHVVNTRPPGRRVGLSRPDVPNTTYVGETLDWRSCGQRFPRCERTVGEMLSCMEIAQRGDPWFMLNENARCRPMRECVWGFEAMALPKAEARRYLDYDPRK